MTQLWNPSNTSEQFKVRYFVGIYVLVCFWVEKRMWVLSLDLFLLNPVCVGVCFERIGLGCFLFKKIEKTSSIF